MNPGAISRDQECHAAAPGCILYPVTRAHWYHRDQRGSWSIKAVLPTMDGAMAYDGLAIADGADAQLAYLEAIDPTTPPQRCAEIDRALRAYCRRDTEAMMVLYRRLVGGGG